MVLIKINTIGKKEAGVELNKSPEVHQLHRSNYFPGAEKATLLSHFPHQSDAHPGIGGERVSLLLSISENYPVYFFYNPSLQLL